jgi:hypothetical protein
VPLSAFVIAGECCILHWLEMGRTRFNKRKAPSVQWATTEAVMSTTGDQLLESFDLLPEPEKQQVAPEVLRRALASNTELDEAQLATLYAEAAEADRQLAEEGMESYEKSLASENAE